MRQVVLDTETTGIDPQQGHRIIEIGCVELVDRKLTGNHYHQYLNPSREIEAEAVAVHGITGEFLADKPHFEEVAPAFIEFVRGAQLVIHNAPFDVGFIDSELQRCQAVASNSTADICTVLDTLALARAMHPGQKNNLDVLCRRYGVDNSHRELHGALLDAEILADVYLLMTGGQTSLNLTGSQQQHLGTSQIRKLAADRKPLKVIRASADELAQHESRLDLVAQEGGSCLWRERAD